MAKSSDVVVVGAETYFLPIDTRVPLKFGHETLTSVTMVRVRMRVRNARDELAEGWGETPLSVQWAWPSQTAYAERHETMKSLALELTRDWTDFDSSGHAIEIGWDFVEDRLPGAVAEVNSQRPGQEPVPWLAALVAGSAFDIALHDAYGKLHRRPVYATYSSEFLSRDLGAFLSPAPEGISFSNRYPQDFLLNPPRMSLPAWHLVGGQDLIAADELTGGEPDDGYPVLLEDWIERDGLTCLKIKLRGNDPKWDYDRLVKVGQIALKKGVVWLTADFNCTVLDPSYVNEILDRLMVEHSRIWQLLLYVEQPFPYELEKHRIDVHSVSARKPLFMDESAHDWRLVRLGRSLGWSGVALKTCKTQSGALLAACWARAHGMSLMVQDLTNPMLAQIPHCLLAAHCPTIMGVETNSMQFYPEASRAEAAIHPGLYRRRRGSVELSSIRGSGFGYRIDEIERMLPEPSCIAGEME